LDNDPVGLSDVINYSNMAFLRTSEVIKALRFLVTYINGFVVPENALTQWFPEILRAN
jgi:hypothetical protein